MSFAAFAGVGLGVASLITGVMNANNQADQQRRSADAQARAQDAANRVARDGLNFQKQQYGDWQKVYGSLQTNLGNYYKHLGPEKIMSMGLQNQQKEYHVAKQKLEADFARRGLGDSQFEDYTMAQLDNSNAQMRAGVRSNAEAQVMQQKSSFLGLGLGQGQAMRNNIGNAANNQAGVYNQQAGMQGQLAGQYGQNQFNSMNNISNSTAFLSYLALNNQG